MDVWFRPIADIRFGANLAGMWQTIWRWIKRGTLAVIALLALLGVIFCLFVVYEKHHFAQFNRTHERPLSNDVRTARYAEPNGMLARLKPVQGTDNLRFVSIPSFGKKWFAVSVSVIKGQGVGEAVVTSPAGDVIRHETFVLPKSELLLFLTRWDEVVDGYSGEGRGFTDGTLLAFERRHNTHITSGMGNSPCHYDVLGDWAAQTFERYVPEMQDLRQPSLAMLLKTRFCNPSIFDLR